MLYNHEREGGWGREVGQVRDTFYRDHDIYLGK